MLRRMKIKIMLGTLKNLVAKRRKVKIVLEVKLLIYKIRKGREGIKKMRMMIVSKLLIIYTLINRVIFY